MDKQILIEERTDNYYPMKSFKWYCLMWEIPLRIQQKHMLYCHRPDSDLMIY